MFLSASATQPLNRMRQMVHARWRLWGRIGVGMVLLLMAATLIASFSPFVTQLQTPCAAPDCHWYQLTPTLAHDLLQSGYSWTFYTAFYVSLNLLGLLVSIIVAAIILIRRPTEPFALLAAFTLAVFGGTHCDLINALVGSHTAWEAVATGLSCLGSISILTFGAQFPDGHWAPSWMRWIIGGWWIVNIIGYALPVNWPLNATRPGSGFALIVLGFFLPIVVAQIYRYRRVANDIQRQQTKWVLVCLLLGLSFFFVCVLVVLPQITTLHATTMTTLLVIHASLVLAQLSIPLAIGFALVRYRLWAVDVLLHHTLVYGAMTSGVIGGYIVVVGYLGTFFHANSNLLMSLIVTGFIAVCFQPLREWVQHGVTRFVYGDRDAPHLILARLGHRLETTLAPESVLPLVVETIREALHLPYVAAVLMAEDGTEQIAAVAGIATEPILRLPIHQHQTVMGTLLLAPRPGDQHWSVADRRVLADLLPQVSATMQRLRLINDLRQTTIELQIARERIVLAREEERRRLQRSLHDDLAPTLAALSLTSAGVERTITNDPATAVRLAAELRAALRTTVADIRTMAYALRPPLLAELGLAGTLQDLGEQMYQTGGLPCLVDVGTDLPVIPAAIEVAAYYIVQEALRNVSRHAHARTCRLRVWCSASPMTLHLDITDDGCGITLGQVNGVGLLNMRERATELGGTCSIKRLAGWGGTRVVAHFSLDQEVV